MALELGVDENRQCLGGAPQSLMRCIGLCLSSPVSQDVPCQLKVACLSGVGRHALPSRCKKSLSVVGCLKSYRDDKSVKDKDAQCSHAAKLGDKTRSMLHLLIALHLETLHCR